MTGRMVSHYRILGPLGSGGMGVVYLAEDERLGRQVALKFLPSAWSNERKALERFRVEARAASSLSHPAICAIYDIGEDEGVPFIVMEALKGETLRDRIARGPLKVADVLDIGIQLADALGAAHEQGIIHRDIKPANIFLSDKNRARVLDFGLAKLTSATSHLSSGSDTTSPASPGTRDDQITIPGTALGTVSYMSPEQARGEDVDARTDLFSFGAVLYEMVTGTQAFGGSTTAVVYDAILNRAPRPISRLNPLVPPKLEAVIATALEKDRDFRQQHATDLEAELKRIRRDLDSASQIHQQQSFPAVAAAAPTVVSTPAEKAPTGRGWERAIVLVAVAAGLLAGAWVWRDLSMQEPSESSSTDSVSAPVTPQAPPPDADAAAPAEAPPAQAAARGPDSGPPPPPSPTPRAEPGTSVTPRDTSRSEAPREPRNEPPRAPEAAPVSAPIEVAPQRAAAPPQTTSTTPAPEAPARRAEPAPQIPAAPVTPAPVISSPPPAVTAPTPAASVPPASTTPTVPVPRPQAASQPTPPANQPAETDEAAIRRVVRTLERAIETKNIELFRSVRPRLSESAEATVRQSFRDQVNQEVDIRVDNVRIDGRTATAHIVRRDTLVISGRRRTENSETTLRFEKTDAGWIIAD